MSNESTCPVFRYIAALNEEFGSDFDEPLVCEFYDCPPNVFWEELHWKRHETEHSRAMLNCVNYGIEILGGMTMEDIAALYQTSRQRIEQILTKVLFGRLGIGRHIANDPTLRTIFGVTQEDIDHFQPIFDGVERLRVKKQEDGAQRRSERRRSQSPCHTRPSKITSGRIQRLQP
jgi:hypothetical protein